ncbi:MAG: hypothetical protein WC496_11175 [Phycisphaerae bacterium]|jgi:hypothetical protein
MAENKKENIDVLLSKFYSAGEVERIKIDIAETDRLFEKFLAPKISQETVDRIKLQISRKQKRIAFLTIFVKTAAVAAVVIIGAVLLLQDTGGKKPADNYAQNGYQASLSQVDSSIAALEKEIELLRGELFAVRLNEDDGTNGRLAEQVGNVETEIIDTENFFWKG